MKNTIHSHQYVFQSLCEDNMGHQQFDLDKSGVCLLKLSIDLLLVWLHGNTAQKLYGEIKRGNSGLMIRSIKKCLIDLIVMKKCFSSLKDIVYNPTYIKTQSNDFQSS